MFWLSYVTMNIKNILLWLEWRQGDVCALINAVVNNALFHFNLRINLILPQIIYILHYF